MTDEPEFEVISRRRALSLFGLAGASALTAPTILLRVAAAEVQTIPAAFAQVDKPLPGEGDAARTSPQVDKPIPADQTLPRHRRYRHKQRAHHRKNRGERRVVPQPGSSEDKPK